MTEEPWMAESRLQWKRDREFRRRPVCVDCHRPIEDAAYFPMEEEALCPRCVRWRMVELE